MRTLVSGDDLLKVSLCPRYRVVDGLNSHSFCYGERRLWVQGFGNLKSSVGAMLCAKWLDVGL